MDTLPQSGDRGVYEANEHAWIARRIDALRGGKPHLLDRDSLVEYLTDMTIGDEREVRTRFTVLVHHILKILPRPERHTRSRNLTVVQQQQQLLWTLKAVPSLGAKRQALFAGVYDEAVARAAAETGLPMSVFPPASPWTADMALAFVPPEPPPRARRARRA
jgi:hypothetical protein